MTKIILRRPEVQKKTGLCRTKLQNLINAGEFPKPVKLGGSDARAVGFVESEVDAWIDARIAERDAEIVGGVA